MKPATILVVEDESICGIAIQETLQRAGHVVPEPIASGDDVLAAVLRHRPDIVIMDIRLKSYIDGIDAAQRLRMVSSVPVIYVTAYPSSYAEERMARSTPAACLQKPLDEDLLLGHIERILAEPRKPAGSPF